MHRILFALGPFIFYSYGLLVSLGFILGALIFFKQAKKRGFDTSKIYDVIIYSIISGLIGARIAYILTNLNEYHSVLDMFKFWQGGLSSYGGLVFAILIGFLILRKEKLGKWFDVGIFGLLLGMAIGRIGCFLNGCCFGQPTNLLWAVTYPQGTFAAQIYPSIPLHPTQLYESFGYALSFIILLYLSKRIKIFDGGLFLIGLISHSIVRFVVEYFRYNTLFVFKMNNWYNTLSFSQFVCLLIIVISLLIFIKFKRKANRDYSFTKNYE